MSLRILREKGCWWETASDGWDINKPLTDGGAVMWAITQGQNEDYSRKMSYHSKKGKTGKAKEGYSNGRPVYGYQAPIVHVDGTVTAQDIKRLRRRLVYEPDPLFFPGLQKLGDLAAQQHPVLSYAAIARELNRGGPLYYNAAERTTSDWTSERIAALLCSVYPREFAPGGGKGTIRLPDGTLTEGLHLAAWPYDVFQRIEENRRLIGTRPMRYKGRVLGPLQGLLSCRHCGRPMRFRESPAYKATSGGRHQYLYAYYVCRYRRGAPCTSPNRREGVWVRDSVVHEQFGRLLAVFGAWLPDAIEFIKREYTRVEGEDVDGVIEYQRKKEQFATRRQKINDMFEMGGIDREEYLRRIDRLRKEELALPLPRTQGQGFDQQLKAAQRIDTIGDQWDQLASLPGMRHELAHALLEPNGLVYDGSAFRIVGVRPAPAFYLIIKYILEREGWEERERGLLWHDNYETVAARVKGQRYDVVAQALRTAQVPLTAREILSRVDARRSAVQLNLNRMVAKGVAARSNRDYHTYEYRWIGAERPIEERDA
jgi:YD repeat-containing protein